MRTTLTLDDDVYLMLQSETRLTGRPLKQVVNEHLRRSLAAGRGGANRPAFRVEARDMGLRPGADPANVQELLHRLDG